MARNRKAAAGGGTQSGTRSGTPAAAGSGSLFMDGTLTKAEALAALRIAAERATEALHPALALCKNDEERRKVIADRDVVMVAYLSALQKTLVHTGPLFEQMAADLASEAEQVRVRTERLQSASEATGLFAEIVRLAGSLALAFA
jgi:hypothetical protein